MTTNELTSPESVEKLAAQYALPLTEETPNAE